MQHEASGGSAYPSPPPVPGPTPHQHGSYGYDSSTSGAYRVRRPAAAATRHVKNTTHIKSR